MTEKRFVKHRRHNSLYAEPGPNDFVIVLDNLKPSFNIGKIFRSSEAFGACSIHLIGTDFFDAKAAKGSFKWVPAFFHETFEECYSTLARQGYSFIILETESQESLHTTLLPRKSAFIFGHEEFGVSFDRTIYSELSSIRVEQVGRVESLNVSVAASIVMYEYYRQHADIT